MKQIIRRAPQHRLGYYGEGGQSYNLLELDMNSFGRRLGMTVGMIHMV